MVMATVTILALAPNAYANPNVSTYNEDGTLTDRFIMGEKVRIIAYSSYPEPPYEIIVIDPDGITRFTDTSNFTNYDSGLLSGITDKPGWWEVKAGKAGIKYGTAWYNVVPEVPLGTLSILITCFAALGISTFRKHFKSKPSSVHI